MDRDGVPQGGGGVIIVCLAPYQGYVYNPHGIPIVGVTVNFYWPEEASPFIFTTTDPNGYWNIKPGAIGEDRILEFINGAETVRIRGHEVQVTTPGQVRRPSPAPWWRRMWGLE